MHKLGKYTAVPSRPTELSEQDICDKIISPALHAAGWDRDAQVFAQYVLKPGRIVVRGQLASRMKDRRADYVLFGTQSVPLAVVEVKRAKYSLATGMQQALEYAEALDAPFAFSTNGSAFLMHDLQSEDRHDRVSPGAGADADGSVRS